MNKPLLRRSVRILAAVLLTAVVARFLILEAVLPPGDEAVLYDRLCAWRPGDSWEEMRRGLSRSHMRFSRPKPIDGRTDVGDLIQGYSVVPAGAWFREGGYEDAAYWIDLRAKGKFVPAPDPEREPPAESRGVDLWVDVRVFLDRGMRYCGVKVSTIAGRSLVARNRWTEWRPPAPFRPAAKLLRPRIDFPALERRLAEALPDEAAASELRAAAFRQVDEYDAREIVHGGWPNTPGHQIRSLYGVSYPRLDAVLCALSFNTRFFDFDAQMYGGMETDANDHLETLLLWFGDGGATNAVLHLFRNPDCTVPDLRRLAPGVYLELPAPPPPGPGGFDDIGFGGERGRDEPDRTARVHFRRGRRHNET